MNVPRGIRLASLVGWFCLAQNPLWADGFEFSAYTGLGYLFNDASSYRVDFGDGFDPEALLHVRVDEGLRVAFPVSGRWRLGFQAGFCGIGGFAGKSPDGSPGFALISIPVEVYAQYGESPSVAVLAGYSASLDLEPYSGTDAGGIMQGVRLGWRDWYCQFDLLYDLGNFGSPTVKLIVGYDGWLKLLNRVLNGY